MVGYKPIIFYWNTPPLKRHFTVLKHRFTLSDFRNKIERPKSPTAVFQNK